MSLAADEKHARGLLFGIATTWMILPLIALILRFVTKYRANDRILPREYWTAPVIVLCLVPVVIDYIGLSHGAGIHTNNVDPDIVVSFRKSLFAFQLLWSASILAVKLGILSGLYHACSTRRISIVGTLAGIFALCSFLINFFGFTLQCLPVERFFQVSTNTCDPHEILYHAISIVNTVSDFLVLAVPLISLPRLELSKGLTIWYGLLYLLGILVCISGIFRTLAIKHLISDDITYTAIPFILWSTIEVQAGLMIAILLPVQTVTPQTPYQYPTRYTTDYRRRRRENPASHRSFAGRHVQRFSAFDSRTSAAQDQWYTSYARSAKGVTTSHSHPYLHSSYSSFSAIDPMTIAPPPDPSSTPAPGLPPPGPTTTPIYSSFTRRLVHLPLTLPSAASATTVSTTPPRSMTFSNLSSSSLNSFRSARTGIAMSSDSVAYVPPVPVAPPASTRPFSLSSRASARSSSGTVNISRTVVCRVEEATAGEVGSAGSGSGDGRRHGRAPSFETHVSSRHDERRRERDPVPGEDGDEVEFEDAKTSFEKV